MVQLHVARVQRVAAVKMVSLQHCALMAHFLSMARLTAPLVHWDITVRSRELVSLLYALRATIQPITGPLNVPNALPDTRVQILWNRQQLVTLGCSALTVQLHAARVQQVAAVKMASLQHCALMAHFLSMARPTAPLVHRDITVQLKGLASPSHALRAITPSTMGLVNVANALKLTRVPIQQTHQ